MSPPRPDISDRLLAHYTGLPRICAIRACRRHRRCVGPGAICLAHHDGLVTERLNRAGWATPGSFHNHPKP